MSLFWQIYEWCVTAFWAVMNLSPETINQYADQLRVVALRDLVRDHLRRDRAWW